jgi:Baseplate J-like protein
VTERTSAAPEAQVRAVVVTSDESLPDIIDRACEAGSGGHAVDLVVPIDSAHLLTAAEFRALKDAVDKHRLALTLRTADPLRLQLAERLGIRAQAMARPRLTAPLAAPVPAKPVESAPLPAAMPERTADDRPAIDPMTLWPEQLALEEGDGIASDDARPAATSVADNPPRRWLPMAALLLALVLLASLALRFVLPQAVVHIVPKSAPVTGSVLFDVTVDGKPLADGAAFALPTQTREAQVVWSGSAPVTGVRVEPDGAADGPIELRNSSPEPVVVDAGTTVSTEEGVEFAIVDAVTVPGADPATGKAGAATGTVRASKPGSGGNVATGEIGGRLPNGIYYSNRMEATTGGTDKQFPVVAQADLDALRQKAQAAVPELVAGELAKDAHAAYLPSTLSIAAENDQFDHQAGEDASTVNLQATLTVQAKTFDLDAAAAAYEPALTQALRAKAPDGYAVAVDAIAFDPPKETKSGDRGARLEVDAHANAAAVLDDAQRAALAAQLAGKSPQEAEAILKSAPQITQFTIDYRPSWLPDEMPKSAQRITFEESR